MDIDEIIKAAMEPLVPVCVIDVYGGKAEEFVVYTYTGHRWTSETTYRTPFVTRCICTGYFPGGLGLQRPQR